MAEKRPSQLNQISQGTLDKANDVVVVEDVSTPDVGYSTLADLLALAAKTDVGLGNVRNESQMPDAPWAQKTANFTFSSRQLIQMDQGITGTLPASPAQGDWVKAIPLRDWTASNPTIDRNGENIQGSASNLTLDKNNGITLIYTDATWGWSLLGA